ncbi:uncharacterized protein PHACADRAFT_197351 [Phanerochaete carnosa HHB-10118-sp]|uniref:Alpha/beta-hydrolase n=1 Tax=Phanerochaete carnosa (strain HHB-10118-sp) TaxID=650164 RepID=K5W6Z6_PHACS|nr:uncharacterized protein PHACADRAFT_197351 [Phanerochaete carnosa HHB-10118-sp]EKM54920.1 hypothetical protein PHACADRAFT_197351 [Phanerochaete carnosa HHB-10118-sp]
MFTFLVLITTTAVLVLHRSWASLLFIGNISYAHELEPFFHLVKTHDDLCIGGTSHSGYIGLEEDSEDKPKRSFFWYFEAQNNHEDAPVILTIGGGPGSSGMANPLFGQSHCKVTENKTTVANPNAWSENYNLVALDHPIGVGFSYGTQVNNSRAAAYDAYDFLIKFFHLFPKLANNKLVLAGGSYGGTYIPHIATVIREQNAALAAGGGVPGATHLNLEAMMVSNPMSDLLTHKRWALQQRCYYTDFYNTSTCNAAFERLPFCLESIQMAYMNDTVENRALAMAVCEDVYPDRVPGRSLENVNLRCDGTLENCTPETTWASDFMNLPATKATLGVPEHLNFSFVSRQVHKEFVAEGDMVQQAYLLYEDLLRAGYRLLHYIGKLDANCAWPGVLSMLRLVRSQYQSAFLAAPDLPWTSEDATVRAIGPGAGNFTYVLMGSAGHFVTDDQPVLVKKILYHWVENVPFEVEQDQSGAS